MVLHKIICRGEAILMHIHDIWFYGDLMTIDVKHCYNIVFLWKFYKYGDVLLMQN